MLVRSQAEIADLVYETRQHLGLTQTELAQELGVSVMGFAVVHQRLRELEQRLQKQ